jgi:hypothetical protein
MVVIGGKQIIRVMKLVILPEVLLMLAQEMVIFNFLPRLLPSPDAEWI